MEGKERPDGEKARQQKSKVHEWLLRQSGAVDTRRPRYISANKTRVTAFTRFSTDSDLGEEVKAATCYFRGENRLSRLMVYPRAHSLQSRKSSVLNSKDFVALFNIPHLQLAEIEGQLLE